MPVPSRLDRYIETDKQKHFLRDFMVGWEAYETWDQAAVGQSGIGQRSFEIREEDILDYNRACGETDPVMVDPAYLCAEELAHGRASPASGLRHHDRVLQPG
jgi:hypothetical protein